MKRFLILATVLLIVALACLPATAAVKYINGATSTNAVSATVAQTDGKWTAASGFPDGWSAAGSVNAGRYNIAPYNRTFCAYNTTSGQSAFMEIEVTLGSVGYWAIAAIQPTASLGTGDKTVTGLVGWVGLPATTNMFSTGGWNTMGTYYTNVVTPKIRFDERATTTNRWYFDQLRFTAATPGAVTPTYPSDTATNVPITGGGNELTWTGGNYTVSYDVYMDASPTSIVPTTKVGSDLTVTTFDAETISGGLVAGTTYWWKVVAKNVDMTTATAIRSFTATSTPAYVISGQAVTRSDAGTYSVSTDGGTVTGQAWYIPGGPTLTYTATATVGPPKYYFGGWTTDVDGTTNTTMPTQTNPTTPFTPTGPMTFYAQFAKDTTAPVGSISIDGGATNASSQHVLLTVAATDAQSGMATMQFSNDNFVAQYSAPEAYVATSTYAWDLANFAPGTTETVWVRFADVEGNTSVSTDTILIPSGMMHLMLDVGEGQALERASGVLTVNGVVQPLPFPGPSSDTQWSPGTAMTLTATANPGYEFVKWVNDGNITLTDSDGILTTYTFTMPSVLQDNTKYVFAVFQAIPQRLDALAGANGTALITDPLPEEAWRMVVPATQITVTATANTNYRFVKWTLGSGAGADAPATTGSSATDYAYQFSMPPNAYALFANFEYLPLLTTTANANGTVSGDGTSVGGDRYNIGTPRSVTGTADTGYFLYSWSTNADGSGVVKTTASSTDTTYTFPMPATDRTLYANFRQRPLLTIGGSNPASVGTQSIVTVSPTGDSKYDFGLSVQVSTTVAGGYRFYGWSTDAAGANIVHYSTGPADLSYTFNMPSADYTLYAQYVLPDLVWRDGFEGTNLSAYEITSGTASVTTAQKMNGAQSLLVNTRLLRMYANLGTNVPTGTRVATRFWLRDPGIDAGYMVGMWDTQTPSFVAYDGVYTTGSSLYESRTVGSVAQNPLWATMATTPRNVNQWNRFDIYFDGATTVKYYVNGVLGRTVTDVPTGKLVNFLGIGNNAGGAVAAGYIDDVAVFTNPTLLTTSVKSGNGHITSTLNGATMSQVGTATGYYYSGENVVLTAVPDTGWDFVNWVDADGVTEVSTANPYSFTMTSTDKTAKAVFARNAGYSLLTLTGIPAGGGTFTGAGYYPTGTPVSFSPQAKQGFFLKKMTSDPAGNNLVTSPYMLSGDTTLYGWFTFRAFTESFESYNAGPETGGDIDMQGANNPSANGNIAGNPWFGAAPADGMVYSSINGFYPHSGVKMLISGTAYMNDQNAVNLAYRVNGGAAFTGDVYMDWWFCDRSANATSRDYAGLTFYSAPMCNTAGLDYNFSDGKLYNHVAQFLAIGCADVDVLTTPAGYDATKYQIRVVGAPGGFNSGPSNYSTGWFTLDGTNGTVNTPRSSGWHHAKIVLGPAKGGGTNDASFYIDGVLVATKDTTTTGGINSLSVYSKTNTAATGDSVSGYIDEIQFGKAGTESIDAWSVIGHYPWATQATRMTTDYFALGTEGKTEATMAAKTGAVYNGGNVGPIAWGTRTSGLLDLNRYYNPTYTTTYTENGVSYLFTYINNSGPEITDVVMTCGSDDGIKVILNGTAIYTNDVYRPFVPDQDQVGPFTIPAGVSRLLVKVTQGTSGYAAQVRLTHADGAPLTTVTYGASEGTAPTGTISINGGAATTPELATVTLTLSATDDLSGVEKMIISNDGVFDTEVAEAYSPTKAGWALTSGLGTKTVYVKFIDYAGNVSGIFSDDITVGAAGPVAPPTGSTSLTKITDLWPLANDGVIVYSYTGANIKSVTAVGSDCFWIEEASRNAGVKVAVTGGTYYWSDLTLGTITLSGLAAGNSVEIYGTLSVTAGSDRVFNASYVRVKSTAIAIKPLGVTQRYIVGKGPTAYTPGLPTGKGIYSAGLFVKLAGKVLNPIVAGTSFFLDDKTYGTTGIQVFYGTTQTLNANKIVTGVVGMVGNVPVIYATNVQ